MGRGDCYLNVGTNKVRVFSMKKTIITVLGTIVLGAIGSGLWDLVLSDFIAWVGGGVLSLFSSLFKGYLDLLYDNVGKGSIYPLVREPFVIIFSFLIVLPIAFTLRLKKRIQRLKHQVSSEDSYDNVDPGSEIDKIDRHFKFMVLPYVAFVFVFVTMQLWQGLYSHSASSFAERSVVIVSPFINEQEFKEINAQYRAIDTAEKFYAFHKRIEEIAAKNKIELPEFKSI